MSSPVREWNLRVAEKLAIVAEAESRRHGTHLPAVEVTNGINEPKTFVYVVFRRNRWSKALGDRMSTPKTEWWKNFYSGLWLDVLRQFKTEEQTRAEAGFIERGLQLTPRAQVLDVPCGAGRLCLELASRGYHMTGVDFTLPLLDDARRKATQRQLEIAWEYRDMRDLPWKAQFDGAFCFGGSFGYFDEKGNADFLKAVSGTLKPGAKFLVDAIIAETHLPRSQDCAWVQVGDILVLQKLHYDHVSSRVDFEWMLVHEGKVEKKSSSIRLYTYRELCQLFEEVGFVDCEGYGSLSQEPFKLGSQRFYLAATKKGV